MSATLLPAATDGAPAPGVVRTVDRLRGAVAACVDLLQATVIEDGDQVTWPTWHPAADGTPERCTGGRSSFYDGDAGIAWALRRLGAALHRADVVELAARAGRAVTRRAPLPDPGLLSGTAGVELVRPSGSRRSSAGAAGDAGEQLAGRLPSSDLTSGLAGVLLALTRAPHADPAVAARLVDALWRRSERQLWGRGWPDPTQHGSGARPLCGMAHGAGGIAWALAETAWRWPQLAESALPLAHDALRFEASWSDPMHGGWPDLRGPEPVWAARWCHGAAGAAVIRLRLLELAAQGLRAPWSEESIRVEAEVAIQACGAEVWCEREAWVAYGADALGQGWTLCHGVGGPVGTLDLAARVLQEPAHRVLALDTAAAFLDLAGDDPGQWPCGLAAADGDLALFNGVAGTAVLLADLAGLTGPGSTAGRSRPVLLLG